MPWKSSAFGMVPGLDSMGLRSYSTGTRKRGRDGQIKLLAGPVSDNEVSAVKKATGWNLDND